MIDLTDKFLQLHGLKKIRGPFYPFYLEASHDILLARAYVVVPLDPRSQKDKPKARILQQTYSYFFPERSARKAREKRLQSIRDAIAFLPPASK